MIILKKRHFCIILSFILVFSFTSEAFSAPTSSKSKYQKQTKYQKQLKYQKQQLKKNEQKYAQIEKEIEAMDISIEKLDNQIEDMYDQINDTDAKIKAQKLKIKQAQKELNISIDNLSSENDIYKKRLRAMYMNGNSTYIKMLLDSSNIYEFLNNLESIKSIVNFDTHLIKTLKDKKTSIEIKKARLIQLNNQLVALQRQNEVKLANLSEKKKEQDVLIHQLRAQQQKYKDAMAAYRAQISKTLADIKKMRQRLARQKKSMSPAEYSHDELVVYAANYLGTRYQWGGGSPSGFDCSGFTKYVFSHFGVSLKRRAIEQSREGQAVSRSDLQPGDLVFFGSPVHHVGIYVGNNSFIHAPQTGDYVKISPLTRGDYAGARRMR